MKQNKNYWICEICFAKHHFEEEAEICESLHKSNKDDVYKIYLANLEIARKCEEDRLKAIETTQIISGERSIDSFLTPIPDPFADLVREKQKEKHLKTSKRKVKLNKQNK